MDIFSKITPAIEKIFAILENFVSLLINSPPVLAVIAAIIAGFLLLHVFNFISKLILKDKTSNTSKKFIATIELLLCSTLVGLTIHAWTEHFMVSNHSEQNYDRYVLTIFFLFSSFFSLILYIWYDLKYKELSTKISKDE
jgi:membrane-anchored protein YejM (alkaline phosphatase superfamily)